MPASYRQAALWALLVSVGPVLGVAIGNVLTSGLDWRTVGIQLLIWLFASGLLFLAASGGVDPDRGR